MAEQKTNRRVQQTKTALREALIDLTGEKPLADITVTDLCARADINRSTFYLHYQGVHALLSEIEEQIIARIEEQLVGDPAALHAGGGAGRPAFRPPPAKTDV